MSDTRLVVEPKNELVFTGPFTQVVTSNITLKNTTAQKVVFKIKTTVPKCYCVKPSSGILDPGETIVVEVLLHPLHSLPSDKGKHKFMVQSLLVDPKETKLDVDVLWSKAQVSDLQDTKLRCVIKMPEDTVTITPSSMLIFEGPFDRRTTSMIKITNCSATNICFKIQITQPRLFLVNPVNGMIEPGTSQVVQVSMDSRNIPTAMKSKDRFLIQWVSAPKFNSYDESVWTESLAQNDRVLKCVYQNPGESVADTESQITSSTSSQVTSSPNVDSNMDPAKLVSELNRLRQENVALRVNDLRLRRIGDESVASGGSTARHDVNPMPFSVMIAMFFVALMLGIILGRIFL